MTLSILLCDRLLEISLNLDLNSQCNINCTLHSNIILYPERVYNDRLFFVLIENLRQKF